MILPKDEMCRRNAEFCEKNPTLLANLSNLLDRTPVTILQASLERGNKQENNKKMLEMFYRHFPELKHEEKVVPKTAAAASGVDEITQQVATVQLTNQISPPQNTETTAPKISNTTSTSFQKDPWKPKKEYQIRELILSNNAERLTQFINDPENVDFDLAKCYGRSEQTPLHLAVSNGADQAVDVLIKHPSATKVLYILDQFRYSILQTAVIHFRIDCDKKVELSMDDPDYQTKLSEVEGKIIVTSQ